MEIVEDLLDRWKKREETKEVEREVQFRRGLARVRSYISRCQKSKKHYWQLGKRALQLGDDRQFRQIAKTYLWTMEQISRWERYLLQLETVAARRDQVGATSEFMKSITALSQSMMAGASEEDVAKMQVELEKAIARSEILEETMAMVMEAGSETVFGSRELSEEAVERVQKAMAEAAEADESEVFDAKIEEGLRQIEEEMRKEVK